MTEKIVSSILPEGIATITFNRPDKRNALDRELLQSLLSTLSAFNQDERVRVLLLKGEGQDFCAGADLSWMKKMSEASAIENEQDAYQLAEVLHYFAHFSKPTLVLAHGKTLGGGLGFVAAADIALASKEAVFGFPEIKLGLAPFIISPYVVAAMGERLARYYFLTGEFFSTAKAYEIGLIHQKVSDIPLIEAGLLTARGLLSYHLETMKTIKAWLANMRSPLMSETLKWASAKQLAQMRSSETVQQQLAVFLQQSKFKEK